MEIMPCYVASRPETDGDELLVTSPVDGSTVGRTVYASEAAVERAVAAAAAVADTAAALPAHVRAAALDHVSRRLSERADEVARLITAENGKPIKWARGEVSRAISTFRWAAEEARRFTGEMQRLDTDAAATGRLALTRRVPKGPVLGISPFNFPLNLVAHKVAPAIAVGAPIVLKPAPGDATLGTAARRDLGRGDRAGWSRHWPAGRHVLGDPDPERAAPVLWSPIRDCRWCRSPEAARSARRSRRRCRTSTSPWNSGATPPRWSARDWSSPADLDWAATRIATFANYQAGQSCIAVQRVIVHADLYDSFVPPAAPEGQGAPDRGRAGRNDRGRPGHQRRGGGSN